MLGNKEYKLQDLTDTEYLLLKQSYFLYRNKDEGFVCFGRHYFKLRQLGLIDWENQITYDGRALVKYLMPRL